MSQDFSVDYENDRFTEHSIVYMTMNPMEVVTSSIAKYICWMEHEYRKKSTLNMKTTPRDEWYFMRISWLYQLVQVFEIPLTKISEWMDKYAEIINEPLIGKESVKHFLRSFNLHEKGQLQPVS